jgi:hypothetical protein
VAYEAAIQPCSTWCWKRKDVRLVPYLLETMKKYVASRGSVPPLHCSPGPANSHVGSTRTA